MTISCRIGYLTRLDLYKSESGEKPFSINIPVNHLPGARQSNVEYAYVENIRVTDIRGRESQFFLDVNGFEVVQQAIPYAYSDFEDTSVITRTYVKYMEKWMKEYFQAEEVLIFDHQVRRRNPVFAQRRGESEQPITGAHVGQRSRRKDPGKPSTNAMQMKVPKVMRLSTRSRLVLEANPLPASSAARSSSTIPMNILTRCSDLKGLLISVLGDHSSARVRTFLLHFATTDP